MAGKARSVAEARAGKLEPATFVTANGTCLFDGSQMRYECVLDRVNGNLPTRLPSVRILRRENLVLFDTLLPRKDSQELHHHPAILNATNILASVVHLPLELGVPEDPNYNLARDIDESLAIPPRLALKALRPAAELEHIPVVEVTFTAYGVDRTYWIDLRRGALPLQVRDMEGDGRSFQRNYDDIRLVAGAGWLPFKSTFFVSDGISEHVEIRDVDAETTPSSDRFALEFPNPVTLIDKERKARLAPQSRWTLAMIGSPPRGSSTPMSSGAGLGGSPPGLAPERQAPPHWGWFVMAVGMILLVATILVHRLRRHS
jgi:hypothetical protein